MGENVIEPGDEFRYTEGSGIAGKEFEVARVYVEIDEHVLSEDEYTTIIEDTNGDTVTLDRIKWCMMSDEIERIE